MIMVEPVGRNKERAYEATFDVFDLLPFAAGAVILILYVLAFLHILYFWITPVIIAAAAALLVRFRKQSRADPQLLLALALILAAAALTAGRVVTWWDDINFWANDARALWATHGFAGKYGNVSPAFGDYPPALSLWKWLFLSFSPSLYREGLQLAAYQVLNMLFLLPLLRYTRSLRSLPLRLLAVPAIFLLPGAVCALQFQGAAADITMGLVYGSLLLAMSECPSGGVPMAAASASDGASAAEASAEIGRGRRFRLARIAVFSAVLMLIKDTGFLWAFFALLYWLFICDRKCRPSLREAASAVIIAGAAFGSWLAFCLINRRIAKLTGEALRMARGGFRMPEDAGEKLRVFVRAFLLEPMHGDRTPVLDLSAAAMAVIFIISTVIFMIPGRSEKRCSDELSGTDRFLSPVSSLRFPVFLLLTGLVTYGAILAGHLSVFSVETQYLDPFEMSKSISRYGAPWTLGCVMLLLAAAFSRGGARAPRPKGASDPAPDPMSGHGFPGKSSLRGLSAILGIGFLLLCADYPGEFRAFLSWRATRDADLRTREMTLGEPERALIAAIREAEEGGEKLSGKRMLYLREGDVNHSVRDAVLSYEVSPVAVVYADYWSDMDEETLYRIIADSKASFLFADHEGGIRRIAPDTLGDTVKALLH